METGVIAKPSVWLYRENSSERTDELLMGWAVGILKEKEGWLEVVTHYGYTGWLQKEAVRFCEKEALREREENGQTIQVSKMHADVMEAPCVRAPILRTLQRGSLLTLLKERENGYVKVKLSDRTEGYIPALSYVRRRDSDAYLYKGMPPRYFLRQDLHQSCKGEETFRQQIISCACQYLGTPYRWGGKSAEGIDCSGLTFLCYRMAGLLIWRDAAIHPDYPVKKIAMEAAKPGDLLYFPGHVAIYLGDGSYLHATAHEKSYGCVRNSLRKNAADYREDLAESLLWAGSVW